VLRTMKTAAEQVVPAIAATRTGQLRGEEAFHQPSSLLDLNISSIRSVTT
jgi:hypothetical protein